MRNKFHQFIWKVWKKMLFFHVSFLIETKREMWCLMKVQRTKTTLILMFWCSKVAFSPPLQRWRRIFWKGGWRFWWLTPSLSRLLFVSLFSCPHPLLPVLLQLPFCPPLTQRKVKVTSSCWSLAVLLPPLSSPPGLIFLIWARCVLVVHWLTYSLPSSPWPPLHSHSLSGRSALHWACSVNHLSLARTLIRYGAAVDLQDNKVLKFSCPIQAESQFPFLAVSN